MHQVFTASPKRKLALLSDMGGGPGMRVIFLGRCRNSTARKPGICLGRFTRPP